MIIRELAARLGLEIDGASFAAAEALLTTVKGGLVAIGTFAGAAVAGLAAAVAKTAEYADQIEKASKRTGIGVESLQALQYAAERADVGMGGLQMALNFMAREGITDFEAELRRVADHIQRMPKDGSRAAYAIEHLGRQGAMLLPMLSDGSAGLDEMTRKAREMGLVLSEEGIAGGAATKDAIEDLQGYIRGLAYLIGTPLLKTARKWLDELSRWIRENRELIAQRVELVLRGLVEGFKAVWQVTEPAREAVWGLGRALKALWDATEGLRPAFIALGVIMVAAFAPAVAVVAAIALALEEIWGWITGERRTLLEDWLGPFSEFKKAFDFDPSTSPLGAGLVKVSNVVRGLVDLMGWLVDVTRAYQRLMNGLRMPGGSDAELRDYAARHGAATGKPLGVGALADSPIWNWPGQVARWNEGAPGALADLLNPAPMSVPGRPRFIASHNTLSVGELNVSVGPPAGTDPAEWGNAVGKEIRTQLEQQLEDFWSGKMGEAATPAVR